MARYAEGKHTTIDVKTRGDRSAGVLLIWQDVKALCFVARCGQGPDRYVPVVIHTQQFGAVRRVKQPVNPIPRFLYLQIGLQRLLLNIPQMDNIRAIRISKDGTIGAKGKAYRSACRRNCLDGFARCQVPDLNGWDE